MNPRKSSGTAYLAYSGRLLAEVVEALGKADDAANYRDTAANAVKAYRTAFTENGVIHSDHQRVFVRCAGKIRLCGHCLQAAFAVRCPRLADGTLTISPTPDKSLGYAKDAYDSQAGRIVNGWRYDGDAVTYELEIPANLTADATLPDGRRLILAPGKHIV